MLDVLLETFRALVLLGIVLFLLRNDRGRFSAVHKGWNLIVAGFGLLLFGSLLDITDNFEYLNRYVVIGDTEAEAFLEKFVGFLGGFVVLALGLLLWVPRAESLSSEIAQRKQAEEALLKTNSELVQEINERKRAEEESRESEARYREIFDESPTGIWETDYSVVKRLIDGLMTNGVTDLREYFNDNPDRLREAYDLAPVVAISQATCDMYGAPSKRALAESTRAELESDEELEGFVGSVIAFLAGDSDFAYQSQDRKFDGTPMVTSCHLAIPPKYRHDWSRVICNIEDITERTRLEEQLRQAQKMELMGQLTGGVAHDFNNLLAVIQGNAELLADQVGDGDRRAAAILRATTRGAELTQRLLAYSRKQPLNTRTFDLARLVAGMSDMLKRTLGETVDLVIIAPPDLWHAQADPGQVENALLNLALNARDAMPGGGKLTVECSNAKLDDAYAAELPETEAGDYVVLAVSDMGSGMTAKVRARAFEPFFTTKEVGKGSGLGLSMVFGFAEQSGGQLTIYSEEGQGTAVKLYLPRAEGAVQGEDTSPAREVPRGRGEAILVVEDDPDVRALAVRMLQDLEYRVTDVPDAATAHAALAGRTPVDLVLSDVVLPGGTSGPEFAEQARETYPNLKIIFMSGYPAEAATRNGFLGSGQVLLNKPFQTRDLAKALRDALD